MRNRIKSIYYSVPFLSLIFGVISCGQEQQDNVREVSFSNVTYADDDVYETVCMIDQSEVLLDYSIDVNFIDDTTFVMISNNSVNIYNIDGSHISKVGDKGQGPGEYVNARSCYVSENYLYLNCVATGAINVYDHSGSFVSSFRPPCISVKFEIVDDSILYAYSTFMRDECNFVKAYDFKNDILLASYGEPTNADVKLKSFNEQGDLYYSNDKLYYVAPSKLEINVVDEGVDKVMLRVINSEFEVDSSSEALSLDLLKYALGNSTTRSVYSYCDNLYLLAKTGVWTRENGNHQKLNIFKLTKDGEPIKQTVLSDSQEMMFPHTYYKDNLYYLKLDSETSDIFLCRVKL